MMALYSECCVNYGSTRRLPQPGKRITAVVSGSAEDYHDHTQGALLGPKENTQLFFCGTGAVGNSGQVVNVQPSAHPSNTVVNSSPYSGDICQTGISRTSSPFNASPKVMLCCGPAVPFPNTAPQNPRFEHRTGIGNPRTKSLDRSGTSTTACAMFNFHAQRNSRFYAGFCSEV